MSTHKTRVVINKKENNMKKIITTDTQRTLQRIQMERGLNRKKLMSELSITLPTLEKLLDHQVPFTVTMQTYHKLTYWLEENEAQHE